MASSWVINLMSSGPNLPSPVCLNHIVPYSEISGADVLNELGLMRIGDVINHDATDTLQCDKGKNIATDHRYFHRLGLCLSSSDHRHRCCLY